MEDEIIIYTDGSSKENPRRGGVGIRFIFPNYSEGTETYLDYSHGSYVGATNQQMELLASIIALEKCFDLEDFDKVRKIIICTDSNYVKTNINNARYNWPKNRWLTQEGSPVENVEHWEKLIRLLKKHKSLITFEKVKAHRKGELKDLHNSIVDKLAKQGADNPIKIKFNVLTARKKFSAHKAIKGCVELTNNPINIRIIHCTSYPKHRSLFKLKYIVVSEDNKNYKMLDWVYYDTRLFEGHTYIVIMGLKYNLPFIKEIIDDITNKTRLKRIK